MRALLLAVSLALALFALKSLLRWLLGERPRPGDDAELVRDPECGVYVVKSKAIAVSVEGGTFYFCGPACAAAHAAKRGG